MWKEIVLWLFVINLGVAFDAGLYEARVVIPQWEKGRRAMVRTRLKVHRLDPQGAGSPEIGLELFATTIGSFYMTCVVNP